MMTKEQFLRHIGLTEEELMHTSIPVSYREEGDPMFVFGRNTHWMGWIVCLMIWSLEEVARLT